MVKGLGFTVSENKKIFHKIQIKDTQAFGRFPRYPSIWEICQIPRHLENFPDTQAFGKFFRYPGIWEVSQIPRHLGNFRDTQAFGRFEGGIFVKFVNVSKE